MKNTSKKTVRPVYGSPIPTKFEKTEQDFLSRASFDTGISVSDLVRRSVKLMRRQKQNYRGYGFLFDFAA